MKKVLFPIMVYLINEKSKYTIRTTFRLKYRDMVNKVWLSKLNRKLDFYAFGQNDVIAFTRAEKEKVSAQAEINTKGYKESNEPDDFIKYWENFADTKSRQTRSVFRSALNCFKDCIGNDTLPFNKVTLAVVEGFRTFLLEEYPEGNTPFTYIYKLKPVLNRAIDDDLLDRKIKVKGIPEQPSFKDWLTKEEVEKLIEIPCTNPVIKLAFLFACYSGLRLSDWRRMKWNWILDSADGDSILYFKMFKTKMIINNYVKKIAIELLGAPGAKDELVFPGLHGYSYNYINETLQAWIRSAGINKHITSHCARVTFATWVYEASGHDVIAVQKALGHKYLNTTMKYIRVPSESFKNATMLKPVSINPKLMNIAFEESHENNLIENTNAQEDKVA